MPMEFWVPTKTVATLWDTQLNKCETRKGHRGTHSLQDGCTDYADFLEVSNDGLVERAL